MSDPLHTLQRVLEASVRRNGEKPLTNEYLLNIVKMARRVEEREYEQMRQALDEMMAEDRKWGSS